MCGICGAIQVTGRPHPVLDRETLIRMTDSMTHRGPNDRGIHLVDGAALGVRRLSIVDVEGGHQPLANEDESVWAIQNGELYNHKDIRRVLGASGHRFRTSCDTEVIPHLYEQHGPDFPSELRGMFGLAVWDDRRKRAVISRDRLGIKPLYYARVGDALLFGSELKALLASGLVDVELDLGAIDAYLTFGFFPAPMTPLKGVSKLLPGHSIVIEDGEMSLRRYWEYPRWTESPARRSVESYADELLDLLDESVRMRLMSDVPLGAMLSGGLDSSLIVALMARHMTEPVKTFSVGFRESPESNELGDARLVSQYLGSEHHEIELSLTEDSVDLEELVWHLDEPLADLSSLGFLALSELAAKHVTVALSGQGADELFAGYRKHRLAALVGLAGHSPLSMRRLAAGMASRAPASVRRAARLAAMPDPVERLTVMTSQLDDATKQRLYAEELLRTSGASTRAAVATRIDGAPDEPLPAVLYLDAQLALPDDMLHYFDRASMAYSLEVRVPFLDHKFVELAATIPSRYKLYRLRSSKHVLKQAAKGLVPQEIIDKPKIGFFNAAVDTWFEAQTRDAVPRYLLAADSRYQELLRTSEFRTMLAERPQDSRRQRLLLAVLMLEIWLRSYLPRALPSSGERTAAISVR